MLTLNRKGDWSQLGKQFSGHFLRCVFLQGLKNVLYSIMVRNDMLKTPKSVCGCSDGNMELLQTYKNDCYI